MITRLLHGLLWLAFALALAGFGVLAARSLRAPQPLAASEGAVLEQAARVARHEPLYVDPRQGRSAALMPAFPAILSLAGKSGTGPWLPRAVGLFATLLVAAM